MKDLITNFTDAEINLLLIALCRSGKVIIPQYYTKSQIEEIKGCKLNNEEVLDLQLEVEENDGLMEEIFGSIF